MTKSSVTKRQFVHPNSDREKEEIMDMALLAVDVMRNLSESINILVV
jgi:hypothetical protein